MPKLTHPSSGSPSLVSPAIAGAANPPPQPPRLRTIHKDDLLSPEGMDRGKVRMEAETRLEKLYQKQVREEALRTTGVVLVLAILTSLSPLGGVSRTVLVLLVAGAAYYALSLRLHSLSLDYESLLPPFAPSLPPPTSLPPSSSPSQSNPDKKEARKETAGTGTPPEQAEWLNRILAPLWPIIDRQLFVAVVDLMEDAIKAEAPGIVRSVRITSLSPGTHPIRLLSLRALPSPSPHTPFSHFHHTHRGKGEGEERFSGLRNSASGLSDPSKPGPAPWSADPEEEGVAREEASAGSVDSVGGGGGGGAGQRLPSGTRARQEGEGEKVQGPGRREEGEGGQEPGQGQGQGAAQEDKAAVPGPFVELEVEFGYRRAVKFSGSGSRSSGGAAASASGSGWKDGANHEEEEEEEGEEDARGAKLKPEQATENVHFVAYMGAGVSKLVTVPFPVLISLSHLHGRMHLRLQLVPEVPFVKTVGFGFVEMPQVGIAIHPLHSPLPLSPDVMTLPLLRQYVLSAIRNVMSSFVLPKHYALDLRKMLLGGDVAMKTRTAGLLVLVLHRAHSLPASDLSLPLLHPRSHADAPDGGEQVGDGDAEALDARGTGGGEGTGSGEKVKRRRGKSDPFVQVEWRGVGKVMYKTKIVPSTLDPVWEEMCFVRVPQEPIEDGAKLRMTVMDHDRFNPNDTLGYTDLPILSFASNPGKWEREKRLKLVRPRKEQEDGDSGRLEVEGRGRGEVVVSAGVSVDAQCARAAYFPLCEKMSSPNAPIDDAEKRKDNVTTFLSADFGDRERDGEDEHERKKRDRLGRLDELINDHHPAPSSHPSGILSFQIHQIASLELPSKHAGPVRQVLRNALAPGQSSSMRKADLPSSYVQACVCDEMVFRTRLKPFSNAPYFNTGSETFCRDWRQATISFAVMDYRDRDHDVLAGYVHLDLKEVLQDRCQVTKWYPIVGGAGSGRLRLSILFKPLAMHVPRGLREWSVGTLEIVSAKVDGVEEKISGGRLSFRVNDGGRGSSSNAQAAEDGALSFDLSSSPLYLPVLSRLSPVQVVLDEGKHSVKLPSRDKHARHGVFWINDVIRGEEGVEVKVELKPKRPLAVPRPHDLPNLVSDPPSSEPPPPSPALNAPDQTPSDTLPLHPDFAADSSSTLPPPIITHANSPAFASNSPSSGPCASTEPASDASPGAAPTLTLRLRWYPGLSSHHASLVLSSSSASRAAYQLYLHRVDHDAALRRETRDEKAVLGEGDGDWEEEAEMDEEGKVEQQETKNLTGSGAKKQLEVVPRKEGGGRRRKGGTLRWAWHTAKVATHRLGKARYHHMEDPKPETELQSAL
ncbi:hypothetical protein JCM11251_007960 [Rhodosporidiobolus azoricus]